MRTSGTTTGRTTMTDLRNNVFDEFASWINNNFQNNIKEGPLFRMDTGRDMFMLFIHNLPYHDRQHFNCRTCMEFLERYGDLAVITEDYKIKSALFSGEYAPPTYFYTAAAEMKRAVEKGIVTEPFITDERKLGYPSKGGWTHFYLIVPPKIRNKSRIQSANQKIAKTIEARNNMKRVLNVHSREIPEVMNIVKAGDLDNVEKVTGPAKFLYRLYTQKNKRNFDNILWREVALAPEGYCHPKSSVLGSMIDDLADGVPHERVKKKFKEKVQPTKYQRPKSNPSKGNVERAEKLVRDMGIEKSLRRRYATEGEIKTFWETRTVAKYGKNSKGVFGDVPTKEEMPSRLKHTPSGGNITFRKFYETVLPEVRMMRLHIPNANRSYAAITTAVHNDAPPILKWDHEERLNPFAWYVYAYGSNPREWNMRPNTWVNVTSLTTLPCHWHEFQPNFPQGAIFILEGAVDRNPEKHLALFPEFLKNEFHEVRSTIEKFNEQRKLEYPESASACGLMITNEKSNAKVYVEDFDGFGRIYHIDRWD